ncbi:MAG: hypothetical protein K2Y71_29835 [Xanthobacteraceae bacterium]|nr:hypothetical protein [Xanthobacteraceae bacterium]
MATVTKSLIGLDIVSVDIGLYIEGTNLNDTLFGTGGADEIHGRFGNDFLSGGGGNDRLFGEEGNDSLSGGSGNDLLDGGSGNDTLTGGAGADTLIGGDGFDTVSYASATTAVHVPLAGVGAIGDAQGDTYSGIDRIVGSQFGDTLIADDSGIVIDAGGGNDDLWGGAGLDVLNGGSGDDWLEGGLGLDILTGGGGADYFVFNRGDGPDLVTDFQAGFDKIVLRTDSFGSLPFGLDGELWTGTEVPTHRNARDVLFYDTDDHQLYYLSPSWNNPREVEATLLATFSNGAQLQASDFILG